MLLGVLFVAVPAATIVLSISAWKAMRRAAPFGRKPCLAAFWMTVPAVIVPAGMVAVTIIILHAFEQHRHYEHRVPDGLRLASNLWFVLVWSLPVVLIAALLSFVAYPAGQATKYIPSGPGTARSAMLKLRLAACAACVVAFYGSIYAGLRGSVF